MFYNIKTATLRLVSYLHNRCPYCLFYMKILLYEPDERTGETISHALRREGYDVCWIMDFLNARSKIFDEKYDASLIEIDDYEHNGLHLIESWIKLVPGLLCVAIYTDQDAEVGFHACKLGSQEIYEIEKGSMCELDKILQRYIMLPRRPQKYRHKSEEHNKAVRNMTNLINHDKPVLIVGEVGTGKSFLAEHIHCNGTDHDFTLEEISCADLDVEYGMELFLGVTRGFRAPIKQCRKGILSKANDKGLIFLKDIHQLPLPLQEVLADVLEKRAFRKVGDDVIIPFTAHFIASCNDIDGIDPGKFNRKLYDILMHNVVRIPSLRECPADIISNAEQMIEEYCILKGMEDTPVLEQCAILKITSHSWPGNYRELKYCMENAVACCTDGHIKADDLNIAIPADAESVPQDRKGKLIFLLTKFDGKKVDVMNALGITAPTLDKWLKDESIDYKLFKKKKERKPRKKA